MENIKNIFVGNDIIIEEMPQGCIISNAVGDSDFYVIVSSIADAQMVIESLCRTIESLLK